MSLRNELPGRYGRWVRRRDMPRFNVVIERDEEGWYVGSIPQLTGCHTQGRSLDELMERMHEAAELCLEVEDLRQASNI